MGKILRGDIFWADLDPVRGREQAGKRPVLVISQDIFNERSGTVIALAVTSREPAAGFPLSYRLSSHGLTRPSWVKIGQIRTLSTDRLGKKIGTAGYEELESIIEGLMDIVG
ncbi:MAG: type II toxin-antitoxin system PemK/MazF family toxin [Candidatus Eremiobacteraeota bacterium]|nr:type II toxin-antitoxin system PemK/MazF family toxin [Candidatus Eremiobacteraeota bacterium]